MQCLNNDFNKFKIDDLTHVKMLIVREMLKLSLNHSNVCNILSDMCFNIL